MATTAKRTDIGMYIHVQTRTHTSIGRTQRKGPVQARGFTHVHNKNTPKRKIQARGSWSRGVHPRSQKEHPDNGGAHPRAQGEHTEKSRYRRAEAYTQVHRANTPKRVGKGTWIDVQRRTSTYRRGTHRKGPVQARGSTSKRVHTRAMGVHTEHGNYSNMDPRPHTYKHEHRAYTLKRAGTGTWIHV